MSSVIAGVGSAFASGIPALFARTFCSASGRGSSNVGNVTEPTPEHRSLNRISRIAGVLPWLASLALVISAFYIRLMFGRWPRVYRDSPEFPFSDAAAVVASIAALSWPAMMTVAVLLPIVRWINRARPVFDRWVLSSCAGTVLLYLLSTRDPYGFLEWAFD